MTKTPILRPAVLAAGLALVAAPAAAAPAAAAAAAAAPAAAATAFLPLAEEAPAKLSVDPPIAGPLADRGVAIIQYRLENFRILPIFGPAAAGVSPRAGHLHVTVDDLPWHWADAGSADAVVVAGLPPGPHKVLIEIATPEHRVLAGRTVAFVVPAPAGEAHAHP